MIRKNIKYYRLQNNITIAELARRIGITGMAVSNYENNKRTPGIETLKAISNALDVPVSGFLTSRNESLEFKHEKLAELQNLRLK